MRTRHFIITVDTEGDNLWASHNGEPITTQNTKFLPRFQELCNKFGFKPVYLTNYEMANDTDFATKAIVWLNKGQCEIGLHVHGWNNPPFYSIGGKQYAHAYLYEYPAQVMKEKLIVTKNLIKENFGITPISHRAGKWAMNDEYFQILEEIGIKVDCSFCPGVDWSNTIGATKGGTDYTKVSCKPIYKNGIFEVPMTILRKHWTGIHRPSRIVKNFLYGASPIWLRPASSSLEQMIEVIKSNSCLFGNDYVMFMVHSSELMPGGSPYFENETAIETLYQTMSELFYYAYEKGYRGCTLAEYYERKTIDK